MYNVRITKKDDCVSVTEFGILPHVYGYHDSRRSQQKGGGGGGGGGIRDVWRVTSNMMLLSCY